MGLRERASDYSKDVSDQAGIDLGLELKPRSQTGAKTASSNFNTQSQKKSDAIINTPPKVPSVSDMIDEGISKKSRLDSILNLLEIVKEFGSVKSDRQLWEVIAYSIMAQLGAKYVAIYISDGLNYELKTVLGYTLAETHTVSEKSSIVKSLQADKRVALKNSMEHELTDRDNSWLTSLNVQCIAPVLKYEELRGFILVTRTSSSTYTSDELHYLKVCGELLGSLENVQRQLAKSQKSNELKSIYETSLENLAVFSRSLGELDNNESLRDMMLSFVREHFSTSVFLLLTRQDFNMRYHASIGLNEKTLTTLEIPLVDSLLEKLKNTESELYETDFIESESLNFFSKYKSVKPLVVRHRREIIGLAFIAEKDEAQVKLLSQYFHVYFLQNHISALRDHATSALDHADNPVMAIKNMLADCEVKLKTQQEPYAVVVTNIANYTRIENLFGDQYAQKVRDFTRKNLIEILENLDFSTEIFHGHFVSILRQKEAGDAWRLTRILSKNAAKEYSEEDSRPIFQSKIYSRPFNDKIPFELLFKA